jgi:hypothetical protein
VARSLPGRATGHLSVVIVISENHFTTGYGNAESSGISLLIGKVNRGNRIECMSPAADTPLFMRAD